MQTLTAIVMALITYVTSIIGAVPALVTDIKEDGFNDLIWMVTESETREVSYEEYYEYYQTYYKPHANYGDPSLYPDLTEEYQALLDENLEIAKQWKKDPVNGQINFYNAVKNFGPWDYKRPDAHPDWHSKTKNGLFTAYGVVMNWEVVGNINFAFTGAAVGFTPKTILTGGGLVNVLNGYGDWSEIEIYYDEANDHDWIAFGIGLYALMDEEYEDNVSMIDNFLTIVDPRFIGGAIILKGEIDAYLAGQEAVAMTK